MIIEPIVDDAKYFTDRYKMIVEEDIVRGGVTGIELFPPFYNIDQIITRLVKPLKMTKIQEEKRNAPESQKSNYLPNRLKIMSFRTRSSADRNLPKRTEQYE